MSEREELIGKKAEERCRLDITRFVTDKFDRDDALVQLKEFKERARKQKLPQSEYTNTLQTVNALFEAKDGCVGKADRVLAARTIIENVAQGDVRQGCNPTCAIRSIEHILVLKHPSLEARLVASAALRGEFVSASGKLVTIPKADLLPGVEEKYCRGMVRTYASRLAQYTILDDIGQNLTPKMTFWQAGDGPTARKTHIPEGGRASYWILGNGSKVPFDKPGRGPLINKGYLSYVGGPTYCQVADEIYRLTGERKAVIFNRAVDHDYVLSKDNRPKGIDDQNWLDVRSAEQLEPCLQDLAKKKKFPIAAEVDAALLCEIQGYECDPNVKKGQLTHMITIDAYGKSREGKAYVRIHDNDYADLSLKDLSRVMLLKQSGQR